MSEGYYWIDNKGRRLEIKSISDKHLNNIRKMFRVGLGRDKIAPIIKEIKRRKNKRKARRNNLNKI